ncbi:MAG TPA: nucleotidyltransferase [Thermoanaerobaculia bacterium]|nr:nucleotidyltransferase [Thermoanaerobaculia bacterium]
MNTFEPLLRALVNGGVEFIVVGGVAGTQYGSARVTYDIDILYRRTSENIERLTAALLPLRPYLRGAPPSLPFTFDAQTVKHGLNFTLTTDAGPIDCLGEIAGVGGYEAAAVHAIEAETFGLRCRFLSLDDLIASKRAAARRKDLEALAELEVIREELRRLG